MRPLTNSVFFLHVKEAEATVSSLQNSLPLPPLQSRYARLQNEVGPSVSQLDETVGHQVPEAPRQLCTIQPLAPVDEADARVRQKRHRSRVLPVPQERNPCQIVKHHEGDQPSPFQSPANAVLFITTGNSNLFKNTFHDFPLCLDV